jgi:uncharacterized membrane protein YfcA
MNPVWMVLIGIFAGTLSGIFGIGGGIVIVPILLMFFGMHYHTATGTSLVALLLPVGLFGAYAYFRTGKISSPEITAGLFIALGMFLGTFLGAQIALPIPETYLRKGFALLLCLVAVKTWINS